VVAAAAELFGGSVARTGDAGQLECPGSTTAADILAGRNLSGMVVVVTGGDNGLGFAAANALAARNASVIIANRNATNGELAAATIRRLTGNAQVEAMLLDLGSLASVRAFASAYLEKVGPRLDILINNAGITGPSEESNDGFELVFQVDYLGHFLLTDLLLPALRASPGARIINVASGAHEYACEAAGWPATCFEDWTFLPPSVVEPKNVTIHTRTGAYTTQASAYGVAKFLNIQHAVALAEREARSGIKAFSLTPGFAATSMTHHFDPADPMMKRVCDAQVHPNPALPPNPCPFSADQGAAVIAHLVVGEGLPSGGYFSRTGVPTAPGRPARLLQGHAGRALHQIAPLVGRGLRRT